MNFAALNTHPIGVRGNVIAASAVVEVEGSASFGAEATASAQVFLHAFTTASAAGVALSTTQFVVRSAVATASMSCTAGADADGYGIQFSNAEIVCAASSNANAVVHRQAVVYVTAQATNVAVGSRVAYASALLEADAHLTANSGKVIFAQSTMDASAHIGVLDYVERFSLAEIICNSALVVQPIRSAIVTAALDASATCTADGYVLATTTASCSGIGSVVSIAEVQAYAQASILASSDVSANSGMVHDVEAHISGLSIAISSAAKKIAVSHTQLTCIAALSAETYSESKASVAVVCTADIAGDAYVPNPVFAEAAIVTGYYEDQVVWTPISGTRFGIKTGYFTDFSGNKHWKVAQYVLRPGQYWAVEYGSATGDDQYGSFWDTYRLDGDMREGSSQGWDYSETKQFSYLGATYPVNFQIPVHDIEQSSIQSVWIDTPVPSAQVTAEGLITTESFALATCLASVSSQPVIYKRVVADINASASLDASANAHRLLHGNASVNTSCETVADAGTWAFGEALVECNATLSAVSSVFKNVFAEAAINAGYLLVTDAWEHITGANYFEASTTPYSSFTNVPGVSNGPRNSWAGSILSSVGLQSGGVYSAGSNGGLAGYYYYVDEFVHTETWVSTPVPHAEVVAAASVNSEQIVALECEAAVTASVYGIIHAQADVGVSADIVASSWFYHPVYGNASVAASSDVSATGSSFTTGDALITTSSSVHAIGGRFLVGSATLTDAYSPRATVTAEATSLLVVGISASANAVAYAHNMLIVSASTVSSSDITESAVNLANATANVSGYGATVSVGHKVAVGHTSIVASSDATAVSNISRYVSAIAEGACSVFGEEQQHFKAAYATVECTAEIAAQPQNVKEVPDVTITASAALDVAFTLVAQEGTRSNGILILVESENRAINIESASRIITVEGDSRVTFAEAA